MAQVYGSANIGGDTYLGVWSGKPYQDPIGASALPNQGVGPYGANSLNGHIGANWPQGPVVPPANRSIAADHGPAADNFNAPIYWQQSQGIWADVVNATPPIMGGFFLNSDGSYTAIGNPDYTRALLPGDTLTYVAVRGAPSGKTWLNGTTATVVSIAPDGVTMRLTFAPPPGAADLTALAGTWTIASEPPP